MNYLAHIYLSGESEDILIGNFMADAIKGKQYLQYSQGIQNGILLHRQIDHFTDHHPIVKEAIALFRPLYGKHTGIFTDILYDYLLSQSWTNYHTEALNTFIDQKMKILARNYRQFPGSLKRIFPLMYLNNWLKRYQTLEGIDQVMLGMSRHTSFPGYATEMKSLVIHHQPQLLIGFHQFMHEIKTGINL